MTVAARSTPFPDAAPVSLSAELTSFVGRREEQRYVRSLLSGSRLVTLTGLGGVGKTRLAMRIAADLRRAFSEGVVVVPLDTQSDPDLVPTAIANALGLQGRADRTPISAAIDFLRDRSVLLVLDNCEHLIAETAIVADAVLRECRGVRVLATSREPLRIQGETVHPVLPLSTPSLTADDVPLQEFESVRLLQDRARPFVGDIPLTDENRQAIALIVSRLEGIPLAIELAAGRLRGTTLPEMAQALTERWDLLTRGSRCAPARQQTMAACIEWSFDLCTQTEQRLWARLSCFADGFEIDAAREVAGPLGSESIDDVLLDLVDKSIVVADTSATPTRYRLLPPLRHRGKTHLTMLGEADDVHTRHAQWFTRLARRVNEEWMSPQQCANIDKIRREVRNLGSALGFLETQPPLLTRAGLAMGADLLEFGMADGIFREGLMWFDRLFARDREPSRERAGALRTAAWFAAMQGDLERASRYVDEGYQIAEQYGGLLHVRLIQAKAFVAMFSGDCKTASLLFEEALAGFEAHCDTSQVAHTWALTSLNSALRGDPEAALHAYRNCRELTEPTGERWYLSYALWIAGLACWDTGRADEAVDLQHESLRLKRDTGDRVGIGVSLEALACIEARESPKRAAQMLGAAQTIWDRTETSTTSLPGLASLRASCANILEDELGPEAYATVFREGTRLDPMRAIDFALGEPTSRPRRPRRAGGPAGRREKATGVLTRREWQVAELVAGNLTNHEVATTLVISKRTAETHVENILTKLGFNNRAQITAWVHEQTAADAS